MHYLNICLDIIDSDPYISEDTNLTDDTSVKSCDIHPGIDLCTVTTSLRSDVKDEFIDFTEEYLYVDH